MDEQPVDNVLPSIARPADESVGADTSLVTKNKWGSLAARAISAAILGPLVLFVVWYGGLAFDLMIVMAGWAGMIELFRMMEGRGRYVIAVMGTIFLTVCGFSPHFLSFSSQVLVIGSFAALVIITFPILRLRRPLLDISGLFYIAAAVFAMSWLRERPAVGMQLVYFVVLTVWANDMGAYLLGKTIQGPKLWPSISPKKTWAGAISGGIAAVVTGLVFSWVGGLVSLTVAAMGALLVTVIGDIGDLLESWLKRISHAKDSSQLIPGHGGMLDRIDALMPVAIAVAVIWAFFASDLRLL